MTDLKTEVVILWELPLILLNLRIEEVEKSVELLSKTNIFHSTVTNPQWPYKQINTTQNQVARK